MTILFSLYLWRELSATLELTVKNAIESLPTVTNSKTDLKQAVPFKSSSIAFFSG